MLVVRLAHMIYVAEYVVKELMYVAHGMCRRAVQLLDSLHVVGDDALAAPRTMENKYQEGDDSCSYCRVQQQMQN